MLIREHFATLAGLEEFLAQLEAQGAFFQKVECNKDGYTVTYREESK